MALVKIYKQGSGGGGGGTAVIVADSGTGSSVRCGVGSCASGDYSFAFGQQATASGNYSLAYGYQTTAVKEFAQASGYCTSASASYSSASGYCSNALGLFSDAQGKFACSCQYGQKSWANGSYSTTSTDRQQVQFLLSGVTTNATPRPLTLEGSTYIKIKPNSMMLLNILTSGIEITGTNLATSEDYVVIKNVAGTTSIVHQEVVAQHYTTGGLGINISANNTDDTLRVNVTGTSTTMRWNSYVYATETLYAT